jgi:hypothetical protein
MPQYFKNLAIKRVFLAMILFFSSCLVSSAAPRFYLDPPRATYYVGEEFEIKIMANTDGEDTNSADVFMNYDPGVIDVIDSDQELPGTQVKMGKAFQVPAYNLVDESAGELKFAPFSFPGFSFNGDKAMGSLEMVGLKEAQNSEVGFEFTLGSTYDSNLAQKDTSDDILGAVTSGYYTFIPDEKPPYTTNWNPAKGASDVSPATNINFKIKDDELGVDIDSVVVIVDGVTYTASGANKFSYSGTKYNYAISINPANNFDYEYLVNVEINAEDLAGNQMNPDIYSFTTGTKPPVKNKPPFIVEIKAEFGAVVNDTEAKKINSVFYPDGTADTAINSSRQYLNVTAKDRDGPASELSLSFSGMPDMAQFTDNLDGTGQLDWTDVESGTYFVVFTVTDSGDPNLSDSKGVWVSIGGAEPPIIEECPETEPCTCEDSTLTEELIREELTPEEQIEEVMQEIVEDPQFTCFDKYLAVLRESISEGNYDLQEIKNILLILDNLYYQEGANQELIADMREKIEKAVQLLSANEAEIIFNDVSKDDEAYEAIKELQKRGILNQDLTEDFRPNEKITRAEFLQIALGATTCLDCTRPSEHELERFPGKNPFIDVSPEDWEHFCVVKGKDLGMVLGFEDGTFKSSNNITRAQALAILFRQAGIELEAESKIPLKDVPSYAWFTKEIATAVNLGIITPENGEVKPREEITRGEFSIIAKKLLDVSDCRDLDTDQDGLPDYYEVAHGLDETSASDGTYRLMDCLIQTEVITTSNQAVIDQLKSAAGEREGEASLTIGQQDSDGDGISDAIEIKYGTNAADSDTDLDGLSDGEEILEYGSDPLVADTQESLGVSISNWRDNDKTGEARLIVKGSAPAKQKSKIVAINGAGEQISLGEVTADETGKYLLKSPIELIEGDYELQAITKSETGEELKSKPIKVTIDDESFLPPPKVLAINEHFLSNEQYQKIRDQQDAITASEIIIKDGEVIVKGNTVYGSEVIATFQSVLASSSVVADSPLGDFEIKSPAKLAPGEHEVILYAVMPDNTRSASIIIPFTIDPYYISPEAKKALSWEYFFYRLIIISLIATIIYLIYRHKRQQQEKQDENKKQSKSDQKRASSSIIKKNKK